MRLRLNISFLITSLSFLIKISIDTNFKSKRNSVLIDSFNNFKIDVLYMNYRKVIKMLLNKKVIYQTIRFALFETFAIIKQNLTFRFLIIHQ